MDLSIQNTKIKVISLIMVLILLSSNIAFAQSFDPITKEKNQDIWGRELVGDAIFIEVAGYEPTTVPASVLNDQEVPIYVYLKGTTLGGLTLGEDSIESAPFYGLPKIKDIQVRPKGAGSKYISGFKYIKPRKNELLSDNKFYDLGYLILNIRKIDNENEIPGRLDLNMTARVEFELENSFGNFGAQDLVLKESIDEEKWKDEPNGDFWNRVGYVRINKIENDKVNLQVYDGSLRSLSFGSITLKEGQESQAIRIPRANALFNDQFRIRLNKILDDKDKAYIRIVKDGKIEYKWIFEGQPIYYGSKWIVKDIRRYLGSDGVYEEVILEDNEDNLKYLYRKYVGAETAISSILSNGELNKIKEDVRITEGKIVDYNNFINKYSGGEFVVPANLIKAVIIQESKGDPKASAGTSSAKGLMQIIDSTAASIAGELNIQSYDLFDPETNIKFGSYLLNKHIEQYKDYRLALLAYMAGPDYINKNCQQINYNSCSFPLIKGQDPKKYVTGVLNYYAYLSNNYKILETENLEKEDVCSDINLVEIKDIKEETSSQQVLCKAINEFKAYLRDYGEDENKNEIYYYIGLSYKEFGDLSSAKNYLGKIDTDSPYYSSALKKLGEVNEEITKNLKEIPLSLDEENVELLLKEIQLAEKTETKIKIKTVYNNNDKNIVQDETYGINNLLKYNNIDSKWYIDSVSSDYVLLKADFGENKVREGKLYLNKETRLRIDDKNTFLATLGGIETNKEAYLTVLPGSGKAISETEFSVHIPIEDYGIKFSDEQIDFQINWTKKQIASLTKIINELDKWIQWGNKVCWSLWGFFTFKNWFTPDLNKARRLVMDGLDGQSGVKKICEKYILEKKYINYDECIFAKREEISKLIETTKNSIDASKNIDVNDDIKKYQFDDKNRIVTENELRDYKKLENLNTIINKIDGSEFTQEFKEQINAKLSEQKKTLGEYSKAVEFAGKASKGVDEKEKLEVWRQAFDSKINKDNAEVSIPSNLPYTTQKVYSVDNNIYYFDIKEENNGEKVDTIKKGLTSLTVEEYITKLNGLNINNPEERKLKNSEVLRLSSINQKAQAVTKDGFYLYKEESNERIVVSQTTIEGIRTTYDEGATVEIYANGRPYLIPVGNGDYVEILEYYATGSPKTIAKWNVGSDGLLGTRDDILLISDSEFKLQQNLNNENILKQQIGRAGVCEQGKYLTIQGRRFLCSTGKSLVEKQLSSKQCTDVFSIGECQVLFNVCDPVMCPASRFNLGGKYQVNNVVQTGLLGSLILGMPNWAPFSRTAQIIPPICVTGVSSSTKSYRSMLEGYQQCLQVSKDEGKNVGICEKIRSVFWCELAWREGAAIGKALVNIKNTKDVYDYLGSSGGGEYTWLQQLASDTSDSAKFFTQEYAKNAFAAYKARSTQEIGSELCKAFIGVKGPGFGEFFDELTKPESPPQFTAYFDEKPWSTEAGITTLNIQSGLSNVEEQSLYNVYYHIYAGEDQDVRYTVFLRDDYGNVAYITDRIGGYYGFISRGSFADKNIDFIGRSGFKEICVVVNGQYECGFGKASTSFGLNRLSDALVKKDSEKKDIDSAEECTPEYYGPSTNFAGVPVVLPTNVPGVTTQNGIVRLCAIKNPGEGSEAKQYYEQVGTCGNDELGRNLGTCWIDLRTVTRAIKSTDFREDVTARYGEDLTITDELARELFEKIEKILKEYFSLNGEDVDFIYNKQQTPKENLNHFVNDPIIENQNTIKEILNSDKIASYRDLSKYNFGYYGKKSQIRIGQVYYGLGKYLKGKEVQDSEESIKAKGTIKNKEESQKTEEELQKETKDCEFEFDDNNALTINVFFKYDLENKKWYWKEPSNLFTSVANINREDFRDYHTVDVKYKDEIIGEPRGILNKFIYSTLNYYDGIETLLYFITEGSLLKVYQNGNLKRTFDAFNIRKYSVSGEFEIYTSVKDYLIELCGIDVDEKISAEKSSSSINVNNNIIPQNSKYLYFLYEITLSLNDNSLLRFGWIPGIDKSKAEKLAWDGNNWFILDEDSYKKVDNANKEFDIGSRSVGLSDESALEDLGLSCIIQRDICSEIEFSCLKNIQIHSNIITKNFNGSIKEWISNIKTGCLNSS